MSNADAARLTPEEIDEWVHKLKAWSGLEPNEWCRKIHDEYDPLHSGDKLAISLRRGRIGRARLTSER